jgi:hypothetical protein
MDRINSTGLKREELVWALTQTAVVKSARDRDACLLCRHGKVNEAGLCAVCYSLLSDEERPLARRWLAGDGP